LNQILNSTLADAEAVYRQLYERSATLMRFLIDLGTPLPKSLQTAAEYALNWNLRKALEAAEPEVNRIHALLEEAQGLKIPFDGVSLGHALKGTMERIAVQFRAKPADISPLKKFERLATLARTLPFEVDFWKAQNIFFEVMQKVYADYRIRVERGEEAAKAWVNHFASLGEKLYCRVE
jgi:hypothetical protein